MNVLHGIKETVMWFLYRNRAITMYLYIFPGYQYWSGTYGFMNNIV